MKNKKGFLLAEALIVSTFVLTILIVLFIQFSNLTNNYKNSYNHNNVESIYDLSSVANYLITNEYDLSGQLSIDKPYVLLYNDKKCNTDAGLSDTFCDNLMNEMGAKTVIYTSSDIKAIQYYVNNNEDENIGQRLREFISKIDAKEIQNKGRLFAEFDNGTFSTIAFDLDSAYNSNSSLECTKENVVASGDGMYFDDTEEGKCIFKGANPNNYIRFNDELWRVISLEADGTIKIIRNSADSKIAFDNTGNRDQTSNNAGGTYCTSSTNGCNAWGTNNNYNNGSISGTVLKDSAISNYLNNDYLDKITTNKENIVSHSWNIGSIKANNDNLTNQITDEKAVKWNGNIALISVSEYLKANSNSTQCGTLNLNNNNQKTCINTNWIYKIAPADGNIWTLTPNYNDNSNVFELNKNTKQGNLDYKNASDNTNYVTPALYLSDKTIITGGNGTESNPFTIDLEGSGIELKDPIFTEEGTYPKTVTIHFQEECKDMLLCTYQINDGETIRVKDTEVELEFKEKADISASVTDGKQTITSTYTVEPIDERISLTISTSATTNSITVVANAKTELPVTKYEFSIDGGKTFVNGGTNNTYVFTKLTQGKTYSIVAKATNTANNNDEASAEVTTNSLQKPTFQESGNNPKNVTITYPEGCGTAFTCTYQKDNGTPQTVVGTTATITYTDSGSLSATVSDGTNSVNSTYTVKISRTVTYNYNENGGTSATKVTATVDEDDAIDLTPTATKTGWTFVGWNTNKNATTALTSLNMGSSNVTLYAIYRKEAKTITVTFNKNNATSQTPNGGSANTANSLTQSCTIPAVYNNDVQATSCNVTSPTITAPSNTPTVVGYNTSASATSSAWNQNTTQAVSSNGTYYAITRKDAVTLTAKFNANGATLSTTANQTCTLAASYNNNAQATSCSVNAPTITRSGYTIIGYNTSASATSNNSNYDASSNKITLTSSNNNATWYALTSKTVTVTYSKGSYVSSIGSTTGTCTIRNSATSCSVTLPSITANTNYVALGWYNGSTKVGNAGATYNVSNNITLTAKAGEETVSLSISTSSTTNSITVVANASAASGIVKYEYSKNGGSTWVNGGTSKTYTFTGLTQSTTYSIRVRVTANSGKTATASKSVTTGTIPRPTFSESGTSTKTVTITYPSGCGSKYTCTYQKNNGSYVTVNSTTARVTFTSDGTLVARVSDGTNSVSSSYTVNVASLHTITILNHEGGIITISNVTRGTSTRVISGTNETKFGSETKGTLSAYDGDTIKVTNTSPWHDQKIYKITLDGSRSLSLNSTFTMGDSDSEIKVYWQIIPGTYRLESRLGNNIDLDADTNSSNVQIWNHNGVREGANEWTISLVGYNYTRGRGYYKLINKHDGGALDVANGWTSNGSNVQTYTYNGSSAQHWDIVGNGEGYYLLLGLGSNKFLDVANGQSANGTNVQIFQENDTDSQRWLLE